MNTARWLLVLALLLPGVVRAADSDAQTIVHMLRKRDPGAGDVV